MLLQRGKTGNQKNDADAILTGLFATNDTYDTCSSRFVAAKENVAKAEPSIFPDTGLMAAVCRHERIIFVANLQDAGEKQYNALALLQQLFLELPPTWKVGVLYDIGCQLHHSIVKVSILHFILNNQTNRVHLYSIIYTLNLLHA